MYKVIIPVDESNVKIEYFETPRYVVKQKNGVIITTPNGDIADGVLSADGSVIYALPGKQLDVEGSTYTKCNMYNISMNAYLKEMDDLQKATEANIDANATQITESQVAMCDIYETVDSNTTQITETQTALCDVYELVASLTEQPA